MLPGGKRPWGANIVAGQPIPDVGLGFSATSWADAWHTWNWSGWIKPQVDQLVAAAPGAIAPVVHFTGSFMVIAGSGTPYSTPLTEAQYFAQWQQLLDYCRSVGAYVYVGCGGDTTTQYSGYSYVPSLDWFNGFYTRFLSFLALYQDIIIGVDLQTETYSWAHSNPQYARPIYRAAKQGAIDIPLTWSVPFTSTAAGTAWALVKGTDCDFMDVHLYYDALATDLTTMLSGSTMPMIIGESGQALSAGTGARQSRYNGTLGVINNAAYSTTVPYVCGCTPWLLRDQNTAAGTADEYGLSDQSGNFRADVQSIWQSYPH